jgi:hypothetical protein
MPSHPPFVGRRPFDTADSAIFHGRAEETVALATLWRTHRMTVLHGAAGVGKTSLLRAGLIPAVRATRDARVLPLGRLVCPADFPLALRPELDPCELAAILTGLAVPEALVADFALDAFTPSAARQAVTGPCQMT